MSIKIIAPRSGWRQQRKGFQWGKGLGLNPIVADQISSKANQKEAHGAD